ncbi:carboxypeptidase regulatory-like domain-containing protein [Candidatus Uhrbacteria bacterium]|nr:carboxypeptidase regulatory-like domain-containing protein [Candidatus Uhrbacteria bacterium]
MFGNTLKKICASIAIVACALLALSMSSASARQALMMVRILPPLAVTEDGDIDYHTTALTPTSIFPLRAVEGTESVYEVRMPLAAAISRGGTISLLFPSGFQFTDACGTVYSAEENEDINGMAPGTVPIASVMCSPSKFRVIVTLGSTVRAQEYLHFYIQGIINGTGNGSTSTTGNVVGIETRDADGGIVELITSLPFFLTPAGAQKISGTVFNDSGAGLFGFEGDGMQSGSELGLAGAKVCLNSLNGSQCQMTDAKGAYLFSQLRNGLYGIFVPSMTSGNVVGGPFYVDVELSGGQNRTGLNFAFAPASRTITVRVIHIPDQTDVRVFASGGDDGSGHIARDVLWNGQTMRSIALPVVDGTWGVGVEPMGERAPLFIIPTPRQVRISGDDTYEETLYLYPAKLRVVGRVVDAHNIGIPNATVFAVPRDRTDGTTKELVTQSLIDGSFELTLAARLYRLEVSAPGMPPVSAIDIHVREDSGNSIVDSNASADVYRDAILVTNSGSGGASDLIFRVPRGERSISGRVLDDNGGPIAFAVVNAEEVDEDGRVIGARVERPTDATGQFTLFVTDGRFRLRAIAPTAGEIPGKTVVLSGKNVSGQDMRVSLAQYGTVKGRVTRGGRGVSGAFVSIAGSAGTGAVTTDTDGNYSIRVKAGSGYSVEAMVKGAGRLAPIENVIVTAGQTISEKNFAINTPGTVVVTVAGVTDAFVDVRDAHFNGDGTSLNSVPGQYRVSVPPGTYTVTAQHPRYGVIGKKSGVTISSGTIATVSFTLPTSFVAQGMIVSDENACKENVAVSVVDTENGRLIEATTDIGGAYVLTLSPGIYAMTASKKGCVDGDAPLFFVIKGGAIVVDDRRLVPASSLVSGSVQVGGKHVSFETKIIAESVTGTVQSASVDTAVKTGNNYTLNLTTGTWTVFARADGYESSRHMIAVTGGKTLNLSLANIPGYVHTERMTTPISPSKGGVVKNTDAGEKFAIILPAGALGNSSDSGSVSTKVTTAVVAKTPTAEVVGGKGIEITPRDASGKSISSLAAVGSDVKISIPYSKNETAALSVDEKKLMLAVWSDSKQQWMPFATTVDSVNAVLSGVPPHFSVFAPIVPKAPPTPTALLPISTSAQESGNSITAPLISGIVPVQQSSPLSASQSSQTEQKFAENEEARKIEDVEGPLVVSVSPTVESTTTEDSVQPITPTQEQNVSTTVRQTKKRIKRFPSPLAIPKVAKEAVSDSKPFIAAEVFELSISVDDASRTLTDSGTLIINGEIIKSTAKREPVLLRFLISDQSGVRILDQKGEFVLAERSVFTKNIELSNDIPGGYYTVTVEAVYRSETVSSSDRFFVSKPIPQPAQTIQEVRDDSGGASIPKYVFPAAALLFLLIIYGIVQVCYTLWKAFHSKM